MAAKIRLADQILADAETRSSGLINPWILRLAKILNRLGQTRLDYETDFARRISELHQPMGRS